MKLLLSFLLFLSLTACVEQDNPEESGVLDENIETDEFTREEMVEAQLPRLKKRTNRERLIRPLRAAFFEKSYLLVNMKPTAEQTADLPLLFAVTEDEVELTRVLLKEGRSSIEVEGTLISEDPNFEVDTTTLKIIEQTFSNNLLTLVIQTKDATELAIEFIQVANGMFVDVAGNEYRALSGVLEIAI